MAKFIEGDLNASGLKIGIVVSRFNVVITESLLNGAIDELVKHGVNESNIEIIRVPGAFEIPLVAKKLCSRGNDAIVCLGAVIRGETPHFEYVASEAARGVASVAREADIPVMFGVLTTYTYDQALERSKTHGNKIMKSTIDTIKLYEKIN